MNIMKTLMLAGFAALSLGIGTAMAQVEGGSTYSMAPNSITPQAQPGATNQIQSGSSDVTPATQAPLHWQTLPTYGGQG